MMSIYFSWCTLFNYYISFSLNYICFIMKNNVFLIFSIIVFFILLYALLFYNEKKLDLPPLCDYDYVEKVYDGDTILTKNLWKVRLLWIDAPEFYNEKYGLQEHKFYGCAQESKKIAEEKLNWNKILFCKDKLSKNEWTYGRKLRYAMIISWDQQVPFGMYLLENWYAKVYKYGPFSYKEQYENIEEKNIKNKIWLWSKPCFIEDQQLRQSITKSCNIKWNINEKWEKYYYLPADSNYARVKINKTWEKFFCDYKQAEENWFIRIQNK